MATDTSPDYYGTISKFDVLKIYFLSVLHAIWFLLKRGGRRFWRNEKSPKNVPKKLPSHLVDNSLGDHWYIKLRNKYHYVQAGDINSPLVILLHGFPDCWFGWRHQMTFLSKHFRVVAFDLKGFGESDKPTSKHAYTAQTLVQELYELVIFFKATETTIIGHSLGALLGWYFITIFPDMINKFVAISCPHPNVIWDNLPKNSLINPRWIQFCQMPVLPELEAGENNLSIIDRFYSHLKVKKEENLIDVYKYVFCRSDDWTGPLNYYRNLPFHRINCTNRRKLDVPVLLVVGNSDPHVSLESIVTSAEYLTTYTLKVVKGAAHFPHQENPEFVNNAIKEFLLVVDNGEKYMDKSQLVLDFYQKRIKSKLPW